MVSVASDQRFTRRNPCPVCDGHSELRPGRGQRCYGWRTADGRWARCTRPEYAGSLMSGGDDAYAHRLDGFCRCGVSHRAGGEERPVPSLSGPPAPNAALRSERARRLWIAAEPIAGTLAERYLRGRGVTIDLAPALRFAWLRHPVGLTLPALVAAVTVAPSPLVVAIHRTFLSFDGTRKTDVGQPKLSLGPIGGGAVRLAAAGQHLVIAEGLETALSAQEITGLPTWAALSTSGLVALHLPSWVKEVTIAADHDESGKGIEAAKEAARRWTLQGRLVRITAPPEPGSDWNDRLRARRS